MRRGAWAVLVGSIMCLWALVLVVRLGGRDAAEPVPRSSAAAPPDVVEESSGETPLSQATEPRRTDRVTETELRPMPSLAPRTVEAVIADEARASAFVASAFSNEPDDPSWSREREREIRTTL